MMAKVAILVIWALAIVVLIRLFSVWDHLPQRVAVHFGVSMQPNGWSSRSGMALLLLLAVVGHAVLATFLIAGFGSRAGIIAPLHMIVATVLVSAFWQMINFNAEGKQFQAIWIVVPVLLVIGFISTILLAALFRHPVG
jgi:Protein of unknown function (DUF1648)